jgi:hypothetical protein
MVSLWSVLLLAHLIGLALGVGSATAKVVLLLKCRRDINFLPVYLRVMKPLTQILVSGLILMTLTGIIWLILGYGFNNLLIVKLFFVGGVWIVGIYIDNVTEPSFKKLAPAEGQAATVDFLQIQRKHLIFEIVGALLFYIIMVLGVLL